MRLLCPSSRALKNLRTPLSLVRNGTRRFLHNRPQKYNAAVIGAGITGLTAAYRLSKDPDCEKVTIYEKASRVGGWLQSETVSVDGGEVVFEYGPRTLRVSPSCLPLLDLLADLRLDDQVLVTSNSAPASQNRYIYYPDHLVRMPGPNKDIHPILNIIRTLQDLWREPVFETLVYETVKEFTKEAPKNGHPADESVTEFISRRFSPQVANNLVSGFYHGVLAGDIDRLSAEALMSTLRRYELGNPHSVILGLTAKRPPGQRKFDVDDLLAQRVLSRRYDQLTHKVKDSTTLTLKKGVGQLADALVAELSNSTKVDILTDAEVKGIFKVDRGSDIKVDVGDSMPKTHNCVIATNSAPELARQLGNIPSKNGELPDLPYRSIAALQAHNYAVTVMVVNMYYENPNLVPVKGFGYLIPKSVPVQQNPERALGVIFASESSVGQDSVRGTKLTVMLGGHWWDGWKESDYPDESTAISMAKSLLERHLGIKDTPAVARARLQRDAIPQPVVGHIERMHEISTAVKWDFDNRLTLAGAWYAQGNTGVVDSIRQGYLASTCHCPYVAVVQELGSG
ncbi:hypothetical protein BJX61DRAFT_531054 [Aspergillus egyptiacus]|nr:hypothetical protein BJX61DRAFT_531054 [Aspergillus egyptiacus]